MEVDLVFAILMAIYLIGLHVYIEFLHGRINKQTQLIGTIISAINRLENEVHNTKL